MRRLIAAFLLLSPSFALAQRVVPLPIPYCDSATPPPEKGDGPVQLEWRHGDGGGTRGLFISQEDAIAIAKHMRENEAAIQEAAGELEQMRLLATRNAVPWYVWAAGGILLGGFIGVGTGFGLGRLTR